MKFSKTIFLLTACVAASFSAAAQYKLPAVHKQIADRQINVPMSVSNTLLSRSLHEAAMASPFADLYTNAKSTAPQTELTTSPTISRMINYAARFLGTRYSRGASGPKAFDCSGFTSYIFKNFGITLNRSSRDQYLQGEKVNIKNLRPGDLLFFSSSSSGRGKVGHVAMVTSVDPATGSCRFIHASTRKGVTYQQFPDGGYYSRNFIGARRILPADHTAAPADHLAAR